MINYRRFIPPLVPIGRTAASVFAALMVQRLRIKEERRKAALDNWEDQGGRVPATDLDAS